LRLKLSISLPVRVPDDRHDHTGSLAAVRAPALAEPNRMDHGRHAPVGIADDLLPPSNGLRCCVGRPSTTSTPAPRRWRSGGSSRV